MKKNYGFASVNEYKDYVISKMKEQSAGEALAKRDKQIIDCVVNSSDIELDDEQIAKYAKVTYDGHLEQAEGFGLNLETYNFVGGDPGEIMHVTIPKGKTYYFKVSTTTENVTVSGYLKIVH